jgi:hypothetical protein
MKYRCSLSVINFKDKIEKVWHLEEWQGIDDPDKEVLFFGLYTLHDYDAWWYAPDDIKRSVFWCGSDILNTLNNPEFQRRLKLYPDAKHYCETEVEAENLRKIGIESQIIPSFLEDEDDFPVSYQHSETPHIWMCAHPQREREYGVDTIFRMARKFPDYTFHIYGIYEWLEEEKPKNIIFHGQVPNEQLNQEIRQYQCGFRGNEHEGLSEVPVKAVLLGQYAIKMKLKWFWNYQTDEELEELLRKLKEMKTWNKEGRRALKGKLNKFPWLSLGHLVKEAIKDF